MTQEQDRLLRENNIMLKTNFSIFTWQYRKRIYDKRFS